MATDVQGNTRHHHHRRRVRAGAGPEGRAKSGGYGRAGREYQRAPRKKKGKTMRSCGSPHNLSACAKCKSTFYCNKPCQAKDGGMHKSTCKAQGEDRAAFEQTKKSASGSREVDVLVAQPSMIIHQPRGPLPPIAMICTTALTAAGVGPVGWC